MGLQCRVLLGILVKTIPLSIARKLEGPNIDLGVFAEQPKR